jgi:hypothetical protein
VESEFVFDDALTRGIGIGIGFNPAQLDPNVASIGHDAPRMLQVVTIL